MIPLWMCLKQSFGGPYAVLYVKTATMSFLLASREM